MLSAHVEQAGTWLAGIVGLLAATAEARHYVTVGRTSRVRKPPSTSAPSTRLATSRSNVPFYKRYFLGGSSSIRGWGRFEVGPISGFGLPIGGHTMLEGSSEVRLPLAGKFGAVAFVDFGNVWSEPWDFDLGDLRYAVGPGLRY